MERILASLVVLVILCVTMVQSGGTQGYTPRVDFHAWGNDRTIVTVALPILRKYGAVAWLNYDPEKLTEYGKITRLDLKLLMDEGWATIGAPELFPQDDMNNFEYAKLIIDRAVKGKGLLDYQRLGFHRVAENSPCYAQDLWAYSGICQAMGLYPQNLPMKDTRRIAAEGLVREGIDHQSPGEPFGSSHPAIFA